MARSPSRFSALLFGPPARPSALVVRTIVFTTGMTALATCLATGALPSEAGLATVGGVAALLIAWARVAVRRAYGCEERVARAESRDRAFDERARGLTERFQAVMGDYEEQRRLAEEQRAELSGTIRERTALLVRTNRRLERVDQMKDEFVSLLAHELRTPLTSVRSYVELLLQYDEQHVDPAERKEFLEIVREQTQRLSQLILEILDLSRLRAGKFELVTGDHDVAEAVAEATEEWIGRARSKSQALKVQHRDPAARSRCDRARLVQIVSTLVGNACQYGPEERPIEIDSGRDGDRLFIAVTDHGGGVAAEEREAIFEPFHKTRRDGHSTDTGTGLGIYLGREYARKMDGDLWVEPAENRGARFVLSLPCTDAVAVAPADAAAAPSAAGA